jgi:glycosyltransferase involved in cell wall biosynthesis
MSKLSVVIVAYNEAAKIEPCLQSVTWADETVVVDLGSTDSTVAICRRYTGRIISHDWVPYADIIRDEAVGHARGEWVLLLDPDERVSPGLAAAIQRVVQEDWPVDVVTMERNHIRFGRVLVNSEALYPEAIPRLMRKGSVAWTTQVHTTPSLKGLRVAHLSRAEAGALEHDAWSTVNDLIDRFARYTRDEASIPLAAGQRYGTRYALTGTWYQFAGIFFGQKTYRDGAPGLFYALGMAMYKLLVWMHMWELQGRDQAYDRPITVWGRRADRLYELLLTVSTRAVALARFARRQLARRSD